ncbi:hypothetical protein XENOCAPTIV_018671 [Xenoophorus captivus]|uniref:Uncharacterized protein n=1 Tax=Xenoophorus captivus TaxID=1517983 RepID=A0ABV0RRW0_9TELE
MDGTDEGKKSLVHMRPTWSHLTYSSSVVPEPFNLGSAALFRFGPDLLCSTVAGLFWSGSVCLFWYGSNDVFWSNSMVLFRYRSEAGSGPGWLVIFHMFLHSD